MKVTTKKSIEFPKLGWSIEPDEVKDLPEGKEDQETILASGEVYPVDGAKQYQQNEVPGNKQKGDQRRQDAARGEDAK